ncbi:hypothetical protein ACH4TQ_50255 [Streptomyces sp. NPDC021218]
MDQLMALLLLASSITVYVAFEHPSFGTACVVVVGVVTLLRLLLNVR